MTADGEPLGSDRKPDSDRPSPDHPGTDHPGTDRDRAGSHRSGTDPSGTDPSSSAGPAAASGYRTAFRPVFLDKVTAVRESVKRAADRGASDDGDPQDPAERLRRKTKRRNRLIGLAAVIMLLLGVGVTAGGYYFDDVETPAELNLPLPTTVFYADGTTPMARLGSENRTLLAFDDMNDAVTWSIVAAEDRTFWTNEGIDFKGVMRAAWNNLTGGDTQGASTITQQYARVAADLSGVNYSRKLREAVIAWKLADDYDKKQILEFYLNTVPFGRGAYGIEAAAQAYLGKSANKKAPAEQQVTLAEAMVLVSMVKQPEANPEDPDGQPGYDPTRSPLAESNSRARWDYVRSGLVATGRQTQAQADALTYPTTVRPDDIEARRSGMDKATGLAVQHVLSELRQTDLFRDKPKGYIQDGGFKIVTTIDKRAQDVAEAAADITRETTPAALRGQPANWQAALVAVEPGTGRVLAYYGGNKGTGSDYAGWYYNEDGNAVGYGAHPPGSSFKVYDLAEALRQKISLQTKFDSPATKEFPQSGRTKASPAGPVRNSSTAACQPSCSLVDATVASLNVPFFDLTEQLAIGNVIEMAAKAGVDDMWANVPGEPRPVRTDLRGKPAAEVGPKFSTEVGIGQYGITVLDHANGLATMAAGGKRAQAHFVRVVERDGKPVYTEQARQTDIGLTPEQSDELNAALNKVTAGNFSKDWDAAAKTGTWQAGTSEKENAHTWIVGYTRAIAAAVWVGTTDGTALKTKTGSFEVYGANYPGPIWQQFMAGATKAMGYSSDLARFRKPKVTPPPTTEAPPPSPTAAPTKTAEPTAKPSNTPSPRPSRTELPPTPKPTILPTITPLVGLPPPRD